MMPVAVLLAAGQSARLGSPKQLLVDGAGEPLVRRVARVLLDGGCAGVLVVTGAHAHEVEAACRMLQPEAIAVHNAQYADGMGTSIAAGVAAAPANVGVLIATCDMPAVDAAHVRALIAASDGGVHRVASSYPGGAPDGEPIRGVPAVFPASDRAALLALTGDRGARDLLKQNDTLSVFLQGGSLDLDTPADVARWREARDGRG